MKLFKFQLITIALLLGLGVSSLYAEEDDGKSFFDGEDVIWQSGQIYFKYQNQDTSKFGKNDHPVKLDEKDISIALESLIIWDKEYLTSEEGSTPVFSIQETNRLGKFLAKGLAKAKPDKDIVFVLESTRPNLIFLKEKSFNAGRAFYKDGKLNLIIGDYNRYRNVAFEKAYDPSGQAKIPYFFNHGSRTSSSSTFSEAIIKIPGVENQKQDKTRRDWFVIDVKLAAESYLARIKEKQNPTNKDSQLMQKEAAKLARERREMRLEMARLRKEMEENKSSNDGEESLEDRLKTLDALKDKGLVTQEEYESKRQEILNDI